MCMKRVVILALLIIGNIGVWGAVSSGPLHGEARVVFLNVGQGDAIFIEAPNGNQMLIDGGRDQSVLSELRQVMPFWDRSIDVVLGTHPDADHIGGLLSVVDRYDVDAFLETDNESDSSIYQSLEATVLQRHPAQIDAHAGEIIWLDDDMYFAVLFPDRDVEGVDSNTSSIVGQLVYGDTQVMLTGDSPQAIENYLVLMYGDKLQSEILKAGHHGSRTSTSPAFLADVAPKEVVISAGKDNSYGHPHQEVVDLIKNFGAHIESTAEEGRIEYALYPDGTFVKK